jgi:uncharacterized protein (TIGR03435 family)
MAENLLRRHNSSLALLLMAAIMVAPSASGQQTAPENAPVPPATSARPLAFEVVSIKPNKSGSFTRTVSNTPQGIRAVNMRLDLFVNWGLHDQQVLGGPDWLKTEGYDFEVKVADSDLDAYEKASFTETSRMLHDVLVDRLKLKDHHETREMPIYSLVVAKGGPKLKEVKPGGTYADGAKWAGGSPTGPGVFVLPGLIAGERRFVGQGGSIADFVSQLSYMAGVNRMVLDKTGLPGSYDFNLKWVPEGTGPESDTGTSIFTAIQEQLGLKLEPDKGPVEVLVIDHVERPSAN